MVICLELGADLHMAQLMPLPLAVSCFSKIQTGFAFLVPAHPGSPGQKAVKRVCVCVCVCVCVRACVRACVLGLQSGLGFGCSGTSAIIDSGYNRVGLRRDFSVFVGLGWDHYRKSTKIRKDCVKVFKARLGR